ncbi:MAG: hypothetical protein FWE35_23935, partial [Streptosporangiales bacterium]|nr:hypothetical protein [Streptosporangiales bacterium]
MRSRSPFRRRISSRHAARRLLVPLLLAVCSLVGLLATAPPAAAKAVPPPVKHAKPIPVHKVQGKKVGLPKAKAWHPSKVSWPSASTTEVTPGSSGVKAGSMPVSVKTAPKAAAPGKVQVSMKPRSTAAAAGIRGTVFTVGHAAGNTAKAGKTQVSLDYSSFKDAYGSDYSSSLRLVELPACALTTPQVAACRKETPLPTANDEKASTLSAAVPLTAGTDAATAVAATPGPSGPGGNYSATKLTEAGSWAEGGDSGAFTYSYPISTPAVPGGLQPSISLNYNSQTVDGLTSSTNNQASWVGDGWNYDPGSISRSYIPCSDPDAEDSSGKTQGDMCYSQQDDSTTLNLNGSSTTLVYSGTSTSSDGTVTETYKAQSDGNELVQLISGATGASNGTGPDGGPGSSEGDGEYWKITEPDGTQYYF